MPAPVQFLGEIASIGAALIWACSMSLYTYFGRQVSPAGLNLFKNLVALICLVITGLCLGLQWPNQPAQLLAIAASGLIGLALGDTLVFYGLKTIGVQRTSAIQCLAPPLAALIAWLGFDEHLNSFEWLGLFITTLALFGLVTAGRKNVVFQGDQAKIKLGTLAALGAAACQAVAVIMLRQSMQNTDVVSGTLLRLLPAVLCLGAITFFRSGWQPIREIFRPAKQGAYLSLAAFLGTFLGLLLMSVGAKYAKAGVTTALTSTYPIWILPIAHFFLNEKVSWQSLCLTLLAVAGVVIMMLGN